MQAASQLPPASLSQVVSLAHQALLHSGIFTALRVFSGTEAAAGKTSQIGGSRLEQLRSATATKIGFGNSHQGRTPQRVHMPVNKTVKLDFFRGIR